MSGSPVTTRRDPRRGTVAIERDGSVVRIEIECNDPYAAIALYDEAIEGAQRGRVALDVTTGSRVHEH